jgi:hypothetical protein
LRFARHDPGYEIWVNVPQVDELMPGRSAKHHTFWPSASVQHKCSKGGS